MDQQTEKTNLTEPLLSNDHLVVEPLLPPPQETSESSAAAISNDDDGNDSSQAEPFSLSSETTSSNDDDDAQRYNPWKNHNVVLSLALCVVSGTADSIWCSVVLSGFLLALANAMGKSSEANTLVGTAEAVEGLTQLVTALPVGYLADKHGKCKMVRFGGLLMVATIAITLWALWDIQQHAEDSTASANRSYMILVVALGSWGIINGISYGPSQALYSDSTPKGRRSEMLTWLYTCYLLSSAVGPIVSIILILTISSNAEDWSIHQIFPVFFIGICLEIPAAILMFFFSEKHVIPEDNDTLEERQEEGLPTTVQQETQLDACSNGDIREENGNTATFSENAEGSSTEVLQSGERTKIGRAAVPYVLFVSSLIVSLGSGASVKYFPLFFKELGFGSAAVQAIFLLVPIFISSFSFVAQETGKRIGRIETTVLNNIVGVSLLFLMTWLSRDVDKDSSESSSLWNERPHRAILIVGVYLFRTGIMNCSYPLLESILMDHVPSNQRARWKSLESIASFGWTGSALVGGILSDFHSYQFTFSITATLQLCGGLLLMIIQPFVEAEGA